MLNGNYPNYYNMQQPVSYQGMPNAPKQGGQISHGAVKDVVPEGLNEKLPENIQNINAEQIANNNGAVSAMSGADPKTMRNALAIYLPFIALRTINDSTKGPFNFAGDFDKTFLGKLSHVGDKISGVVSKLIPDSLENGAKNAAQAVKLFAQKHSAIARSLSTPVRLESQTAMSEANGLLGRVLFDDGTLFEKGYKGDVINLFKDKGSGAFWNFLKTKNPAIETLPKEEAGKVVSDALKELANRPKGEIQNYVDDVIDILSQSNEAASIKYPLLGKVIDKVDDMASHVPVLNKVTGGIKRFFQLDVPMSEISNKLKVASGKAGATALGCALPSGFAKIYEGITSNFVGGKIAPYLQAFFLMQAISRASKAPKGKKLATFMDEEVNGVSVLFTMPLATSLMTKMGGLKYIGMSGNAAGKTAAQLVAEQKNNVQLYRDMIKTLNEKVDKNLLTRGEYLDEVKKIKDVLKGNTKFWQKPLKALGKIFGSNYKAETIKPFLDAGLPSNSSKMKQIGISASNMAQSFMYKLKTGTFKLPIIGSSPTPGGILRFAIVMFALSPLVSKPIKAVVNKIFGKPYDPGQEKQEAEKKAQEEALANNPFNKMSDKELLTLLSKNQSAIQDLQQHPEKMQEFQKNPQKFYEYLKQNADSYDKNLANAPKSPALNNYINRMSGAQPRMQPSAPAPMPAPSIQNFGTQQGYNQNQGYNQPNMQPQMQPQPMQTYTQQNYSPSMGNMPMNGQVPYMTQTMSYTPPYPQNAQYSPYSQYPQNQGYMNGYPQPSMNYNQPNIMNTPYMGQNMGMNDMNAFNKAKMPAPNVQQPAQSQAAQNQNKEMVEPKRTYIPSSKPNNFTAQMNVETQKFNSILQDMDNTEKEFSKYLSI